MPDNFTCQEESTHLVDLNGLKLYHAEDDGQLTVTIIYNISEVEHHLLLQKYSFL